MNDLCKVITIISGIIITGIFFPFLDFAYGESDFTLEAKVNEAALGLDVTGFEITGESDKQICPSGQCKINLEGYTYFSAPTPDSMGISYTVDFKVQDNQTNPNLGAKKKEFLEQFSASMIYCKVDDIIEENGQELYYCHDTSNAISRKFDSKSWNYDTTGIYDAKNNTLKVYRNSSDNSGNSLITNTTTESENSRTFNDCYSSLSGTILLGSMFSASKQSAFIVLLDPEVKTWLSDYCNFYHDKTGVWIESLQELDNDVVVEFTTNNPPPDSLKELFGR